MIRDQLFKRIFIPLTGLCFPLLTGLISFRTEPLNTVALAVLFFIGVVFLCWAGTVRFAARLRTLAALKKNIFLKLVVVSLLPAAYSAALCCIAALALLRMSDQPYLAEPAQRAV